MWRIDIWTWRAEPGSWIRRPTWIFKCWESRTCDGACIWPLSFLRGHVLRLWWYSWSLSESITDHMLCRLDQFYTRHNSWLYSRKGQGLDYILFNVQVQMLAHRCVPRLAPIWEPPGQWRRVSAKENISSWTHYCTTYSVRDLVEISMYCGCSLSPYRMGST